MASRNPNTIDLTTEKIRLADDLCFWPVHQRKTLVYRIEIPALHRFFRVGYEEYVFMSFLDGKTTLPQACGLAASKLGQDAPSADEAMTIVNWLLANELAYLASDSPPSRERLRQSGRPKTWLARMSKFNPFWIKIPIFRNDHSLSKFSAFLSPLFALKITLLCSAFIAYALGILWANRSELAASATQLLVPENWWGILFAWIVLKTIHELAHSAACYRLGGSVREAGVVMVLLAPLAYVDVSSCWRMNSKWSRISVAAAGMYVELLITAAATCVWSHTDSLVLKTSMYQVIVTAGISTLIFNANILMRFDGYYILADAIDIPNLYSEATNALKNLLHRCLTGRTDRQHDLGTWRKYFVLCYGIAAAVWRVAVCASLFIAASTMFEGAGIALACVGLTFWTAPLLNSLYQGLVRVIRGGWYSAIRPLVVGFALLAIFIATLVKLPIPTSIAVPSVVQYLPESTVRSRGSGFVEKLHVTDGQFVNQGEQLLVLRNPELRNRLKDLELKSQQVEVRLRQATEKHDAAEVQLLRETLKSFSRQIEPLRDQVASLTITAPHAGRVISRGINHRLGSFIHEGDVVLLVANETDKQVIAVIAQSVVDQTGSWVGKSVIIRGTDQVQRSGKLYRIDPKATDHLPSPALASIEGGPLPVRKASDQDQQSGADSMRLIEPAFRARVRLDPETAKQLPDGSTAQVHLGYRTDPIATRWVQLIRDQWHKVQLRR
ncbi:HlyD family secretion protein [Rubripirellula amarantea]|uniref:HlyD family secretion protein n=1 Tax=Rubripirellula amarantea TaxID=2527999 RepID=A0A5C5WGC9_9BACT|nr:HlyD family efflux transporter periplasmic adaptor subunit [Rubripirellula amarantea]TWT49073.1 HlyD family secretion protein [Rubripirellula amarantea]